jgi:DNA-directed RNA polymerase sigma subunit (sigma70/sigma32)
MNNTTDNGASNMNTVKNNDRTSTMTQQDCEELKSATISREIAYATAPLSKEETRDAFREMIAAVVHGDETRRNKIRTKVFRSMILLVLKITCKTVEWHRSKYPDASISVLDYLHEGYSALYSAIDSFNPDKGTCLSTFAHKAITNRLNEFAFIRKRRNGKIREIKSLEETYGEDWTSKIGDIIADNGEPVDSVVASKTPAGMFMNATVLPLAGSHPLRSWAARSWQATTSAEPGRTASSRATN